MPESGFFAGQCLNTCDQRSVTPVSASTAAAYGYFSAGEDTAGAVFAVNVSHAIDTASPAFFCAARIPLEGLEDVILQIEHAGGLQAHAQLRFSFRPDMPVILVPQRTGADRTEYRVHDVHFSVEALAPPGVPYKGDWGFKSEYFQSYRLTSQIVRARKMILQDHHRVWQYRIRLTAAQKRDILLGVLALGERGAYTHKYHTAQNNCIIELFRVIDAHAGGGLLHRARAAMHRRTLFLPTYGPKQLKYRGLAPRRKNEFHLPNLESELGWESFIDQTMYQ